MAKNPRLIDLSGQRFGLWTVHSQAGNTVRGGALWACICDCGTSRTVLGQDLRKGKSTSCGCANVNRLGDARRIHGDTGSRLYETWKNMHRRCRATSGKSHKDYASRGIAVCAKWNAFEKFKTWAMSAGYADHLTIERIDVNGNYEPSNCTWIPHGDQSINRRFVQKAPDGELWWHKARRNGVTNAAFRQRMAAGWPPEQAAAWPMRQRRIPRERGLDGKFV